MTPIYRGKELNGAKWIEGYLLFDDGYCIRQVGDYMQYEINPTTLAIHFPDMKDSERNKIFASLSEDGRGGDIVECKDSLKKYFKGGTKAICKYKNTSFEATRIHNFAENWGLCWVRHNGILKGIKE